MFMNRTDSILVNGFLFLGGILLAAIGNFLGSGNDWLLSNYDSEEDQGQNT